MAKKIVEKKAEAKKTPVKKSTEKKAPAKVQKAQVEDLQELFEEELDVALLIMLEIFDKYKKILNTYTDYNGDYDNGPTFQISINADSKGKLESADINLGLKKLDKFMKNLKS